LQSFLVVKRIYHNAIPFSPLLFEPIAIQKCHRQFPFPAMSSADPQLALPKPVLRQIQSLGHVLNRFQAAQPGILRRLDQNAELHALAPWRAGLVPSSQPDDGAFILALSVSSGRLLLEEMFLNPKALPFELSSTSGLKAPSRPDAVHHLPVWLAMFKSSLLTELWGLEMRSNLRETLDAVTPHTCFLASTPTPPGSVVGGLQIASWAQLPSLRCEGRSFRISSALAAPVDLTKDQQDSEWSAAIERALVRAPENAAVLMETTRDEGAARLFAVYEKHDDRVELELLLDSDGRSLLTAQSRAQ
jgi:hypothetical protein